MSQILHKQFGGSLKKVLPTAPDLESIRHLTGNPDMGQDEVFCCSMLLANDLYDRTHERFTEPMLQRFAETLIGKAFLTGHDYTQAPRGRYYDASVIKQGNGHALLAKAFVDAKDEQAVRAIELGIWKDVSIGYEAGPRICDLDGKRWSPWGGECEHWPGEPDEHGKICTLTYSQPEKAEAHEGSAVWMGCQYGAQMTGDGKTASLEELKAGWLTKRAGSSPSPRQEGGMKTVEELTKAAEDAEQKAAGFERQLAESKSLIEDGKAARIQLRAEIARKYTACDMEATGKAILDSLPETTSLEKLAAAEAEISKLFDQKFPPRPESQQRDPESQERKAFNPQAAYGGM